MIDKALKVIEKYFNFNWAEVSAIKSKVEPPREQTPAELKVSKQLETLLCSRLNVKHAYVEWVNEDGFNLSVDNSFVGYITVKVFRP